MDLNTVQSHFTLIEKIPPSIDLHLAATPFLPSPRPPSPIRRQRSPQHELGPYLRDLEPSLILEALITRNDTSSTQTESAGDQRQTRQGFIRNAVAGSSPSEKEWGIKAAKASKSIKDWCDEIASWPWPKDGKTNGYAAQYHEDQLDKITLSSHHARNRSSISSGEIKAYEMRVGDIKRQLGMLELEDLKGHVRDVHVTPNSKRISEEPSADSIKYEHMDDFQAIITAAILQFLPSLARLNAQMNVWSLRLVIMRLVPDFMRDMDNCKDSIVSAQMAIGGFTSQSSLSSPRESTTSSQRKSFSRNVFDDMQAVLKDQISETGRRLDAMLDLLEGSADVLPEEWIESMDELEEQQRSWARKAEEVVQDYESLESATFSRDGPFGLEPKDYRSRVSKVLSHESKAFGSSSDESDRGAVGETISSVAMSSSDVSDLSEIYATATPLVRNVSVGVRKPTGVPKTGDLEPHDLMRTPKQETFSNNEFDKTLEIVSSRSRSGSVDSDSFSIGSSPEIQSATLAAYPGSPVQVTTPASSRPSVDFLNISQYSDLQNPKSRKSWSGMPSEPRHFKHERKRSSTFTASASPSPGPETYLQPGYSVTDFSPDHARPRSASIKSFEIVPRSEVRTIEVRRNRDSSLSLQNLAHDGRPSSLASRDAHLGGHDSDPSGSNSDASLPNLTMATDRFMSDVPQDSQFGPRINTPKTDPVRMVVTKDSTTTSRIPRAAPQQRAATMNNVPTVKQSEFPQLSNGDRLDARISTILTNIPADIRLTSSTEETTKRIDNAIFAKSRTSHLSRLSVSRLLRSKTSTPPTTPPAVLTRAVTSTASEPRNNGGSDIKLYHLHQPGSSSGPIKLYIRLIGDTGERVMVRVGGGWADLSEYLKEYASHHSKRAVSDSHFRIQNIPLPSSSSSSPANSRPSSSSSAVVRRQLSTPNVATVRPAQNMGLSSNPPFPPRTPPSFSTPSYNSASTSRNRTWSASASDTDGSPTPGLGLAGPNTKNVNISPRKQAWVDGMMRQARKTSFSGSERPGSGKGVKGGVRRVLLRRNTSKKE